MVRDRISNLARLLIDTSGNALLRPPRTGFGQFRNHGPRTVRRVAITFDDGPSAGATGELLDVLEELNVHATFFCVGVNVEQNPSLVRRAFEAGHVIGSHSMDHRREGALQFKDASHIDQAERVLTDLLGCRPQLYRPPWGWLTPWESKRLTARGYTIVGWDTFTLDWERPAPDGEAMAKDVLGRVSPGSIMLFHDGRAFQGDWKAPETIRAVRALVPALRESGYEIVTIPALLGVPGYAAQIGSPATHSHANSP